MDAAVARPWRFDWGTVWRYFVAYPVAALAGLITYVAWSELTAPKDPGLAFTLVAASIFGIGSSLLPALLAGLIGAGLHRDGEPLWRSAAIGAGAGVLASELFPLLALAVIGVNGVDAMMDSPNASPALLLWSLCAGAFGGLCSGVFQRRAAKPA